MAKRGSTKRGSPLEGEDLRTQHWEDARHWLSVYADLLRFKHGLLDRVAREVPKLPAAAQQSAAVDFAIIENQMEGYQQRLDLWSRRVWDLQGLWVDREERIVRHAGREATLTKREFQLLTFLLDRPHRYFTSTQILDMAWADPALFPEQVRNYVQRLRRILKKLGSPAELVNRPKRGYSLVFDGNGGRNGWLASSSRPQPQVWVALLRGINLGGKDNQMLAMADLRALLETLGYGDVRTHLQSGNAIFSMAGASGRALEQKIASQLEADHGLAVIVMVRTAEEVADVIAANPFVGQGVDRTQLMAAFLAVSPTAARVAALDRGASLPDRFEFGDRVIYLHTPNNHGTSRLPLFEKRLGVATTSRTWKVITRLGELSAA